MPPTTSDSVSGILDAAERCYRLRGIPRTTVDDIATNAGVSRITVYRRVGTRDDVILATLLRVTERFLRSLRSQLLETSWLGDAMVELVVETVGAARGDDLQLLYASEFHRVSGHPIPNAAPSLFALFADTVTAVLEEHQGQLAPGVTAEVAGEWVVRTILSLLSMPPEESGHDLAATVRTVLVPGLCSPSPL